MAGWIRGPCNCSRNGQLRWTTAPPRSLCPPPVKANYTNDGESQVMAARHEDEPAGTVANDPARRCGSTPSGCNCYSSDPLCYSSFHAIKLNSGAGEGRTRGHAGGFQQRSQATDLTCQISGGGNHSSA